MYLICKEKLDVLCIQEMMLSNQTNFDLKYYNGFFIEGQLNYRSHGG